MEYEFICGRHQCQEKDQHTFECCKIQMEKYELAVELATGSTGYKENE